MSNTDFYQQLADQIKTWALELGFADIGICDTDLSRHEEKFLQWIENDYRLIAASQSNLSTSIEGFRNSLNKIKSESDYPAYGSLSKYDILKNPKTKAFTITIHGKLNSTNMVVTNPTEIIPKGGRDLLTQLYSEMESDMSKKISRSNYDIGLPTKKSVSIPAPSLSIWV